MNVISQRQMAQNDGAATNSAVRAYHSTASNTRTAGHGGVLADMNVVANLNQIVELDAVVQHRVLQRTPVNAGVSTNLAVVANSYGTQLFDLDPGPAVRRKAESVRTHHDTGMQDTALADLAIITHRNTCGQLGIRTYFYARAYNAMCTETYTRCHNSVRGNARKSANRHTC